MFTYSNKLSYATLIITLAAVGNSRSITVTNRCKETIWVGLLTHGAAVPGVSTGWEAPTGDSRTFQVPGNWASSRIWGRRECNAAGDCISGACAGGIECTASGAIPVTLAEFTLGGDEPGQLDWYDVSLVDGYNLPMRIDATGGCQSCDCPVDLAANCPETLKGPVGASGKVLGCNTDCAFETDRANSKTCCTGSYGTAETCPPTNIPSYDYFKSNCPNSYVYAYDEPSGTALYTCKTDVMADYTITFCP